jgi:hypothetical protein
MTGLFKRLPRRSPVKRMHVADAGFGAIRFKCAHCGHDTGWLADEHTRGHRGDALEPAGKPEVV